ncbi:MAG TPA: hypothetical protein DDZ80_21640 [Cyanobacteria bacterium UBA8803]|nr:hypothetical protein [Cyanobacteria bacterium UBA9273]HBL60938.1 hypothetical protein [Cyanobacteria bacterium UBA8803]
MIESDRTPITSKNLTNCTVPISLNAQSLPKLPPYLGGVKFFSPNLERSSIRFPQPWGKLNLVPPKVGGLGGRLSELVDPNFRLLP